MPESQTAEAVQAVSTEGMDPLPIDVVNRVLTIAASHPAQHPACGVPLWSVVHELTGYGKTYSQRICLRFGFDPDADVNPVVFVDRSRKVVVDFCQKCETLFDSEIEACNCDPPEGE